MIHYSMFLKVWIKLCPFCKLIIIDYTLTPPELFLTKIWTKENILKYFIASKDWRIANSLGGQCQNQDCIDYQKFV